MTKTKKTKITDQELISHLRNKVNGEQHAPFIIEQEIYGEGKEPWVIFGDKSEDTLYFFTNMILKHRKSGRKYRIAGCGCWYGDVTDIIIKDKQDKEGPPLGFRRSFKYKPLRGKKSLTEERWVMHEYRLTKDMQDDKELVVCKIKRVPKMESKKKPETNNLEEVNNDMTTAGGMPKNCARLDGMSDAGGKPRKTEPRVSKPQVEDDIKLDAILEIKALDLIPNGPVVKMEEDTESDGGGEECGLLNIEEFAQQLKKFDDQIIEEEVLIPNPNFRDNCTYTYTNWMTGCQLMPNIPDK